MTPDQFVSTLAYELGHACTVFDDLEDRGEVPSDEWASELTADWYAERRWEFLANPARLVNRDLWHHGPRPGERVEANGSWYHLDKNFTYHRIEETS